MEFRIPDMGEGIEQATVVRVLVNVGDTISVGQDVVEVETEKASVPLQATDAGKVEKVLAKPGDKVRAGSPVLVFSAVDGKAPAREANKSSRAEAPKPARTEKPKPPAAAARETHAPTPAGSGRSEFRLPQLGEGVEGGTVINLLAKPGDSIAADQPLVEIETEKANIPVNVPTTGKVEELRVKVGDKVSVGSLIAILSGAEGAAPGRTPDVRPTTAAAHEAPPAVDAAPSSKPVARNGQARVPVPAGPATRRLARELGVDLAEVAGTAPGGRVTQEDVKAYVRQLPKEQRPAATPGALTVPPLPDFSRYGPIETKPFSSLRQAIARNMSLAWNLAPQVTQHDLADITELEAGRKRFIDSADQAPKVTMTVLAVKACVAALKEFPHFNASFDPNAGENGELILKRYYHIGIAVDTERGLLVPVIRDADRKGIRSLAAELSELAAKARAGKLNLDEMRGGTFTITNLGGIGGTAFSPIINYPEVAILGLSRSSWQPVIRDGKMEPRLMLPLSVTYDHRVVDGADGARFTAKIAALFADPVRLLMES